MTAVKPDYSDYNLDGIRALYAAAVAYQHQQNARVIALRAELRRRETEARRAPRPPVS